MKFQEDYQAFINFIKERDTVEAEILKYLTIEKIEASGGETRMKLQIPVIAAYLNGFGGVFGGTMAAIVDSAASCLAMLLDPRVPASLEINVTYVGVAKVGDVLTVDVYCPKAGKNILFATVEVRSKGKIVAVATNTKTFTPNTQWRSIVNRPRL